MGPIGGSDFAAGEIRSSLAAVAAAMSSSDPRELEKVLAGLSPPDWVELAGLIGAPAARSVQRDRSRNPSVKRGRVVLLPGIMGTDLAVLDEHDLPSLVWFSIKALALGGLGKLALPVDGAEPLFRIQPGGLMKLFYLPMQMRLGVNWNVQLFSYDWRLDIDLLADQLADTIRPYAGPPTHLVAHSMGGLVSRAMIRAHPDVWNAMRVEVDGGPQGGRLVMLGTPNRGSFAPVLAFTGRDLKLRALALLDGRLTKDDVTRVVATFPGLYQMLPAANIDLDQAVADLYEIGGWPDGVVDQGLLDRAAKFHASLEEVIGADRMIYVAGFGHPTVDDMQRREDKLRWHRSRAGDGTVAHRLGLLPSVPTFWSTAKHGALPKDEAVLLAIDDLLTIGTTELLPSGSAPPVRGRDDGEWLDDDQLVAQTDIDELRRRADTSDVALFADFWPVADEDRVPQVPVRIEVVWADIGQADGDVVAVGHYQDLYPTAAEAALDRALSGDVPREERVLHAATARGTLVGELGEVNFYPWARGGRDPTTVAVVGLGRPGTFGLAEHEVMIRNLLWAAKRIAGARTIALVLIGSGVANLTIPDAVESLVRSIDAAARESDLGASMTTIRVVEYELGRAEAIHRALERIVDDRDKTEPAHINSVPLVEGEKGWASDEIALSKLLGTFEKDEPSVADGIGRLQVSDLVRSAIRSRLDALKPDSWAEFEVRHRHVSAPGEAPTRLSVLVRDGEICVSAISDTAIISERRLGLTVELFEELVTLANAEAAGDPKRAGALLLRLAVPRELRSFLQRTRSTIIEVDRLTAALPWEILNPEITTGRSEHLGLRGPLSRQLRTSIVPPPGVTGRVVLRRALVIGDPGSTQGGNSLPGARKEAEIVARLLRDHAVHVDLLLGPNGGHPNPAPRTDGGHAGLEPGSDGTQPATLSRVLHHLISNTYDLVHYAGHGTFSSGDPATGSGWLLADGLLTASHLTMVERLPPLVVANACHSGRVSTGLPGLADEFMGRGVRNLLGTARSVGDLSAKTFSTAFYSQLLASKDEAAAGGASSLGNAVLAGRKALAEGKGLDWDVYELYGDTEFRFWPSRDLPADMNPT